MSKLTLAEGLALPAEQAATQVYAFMGRRGSGKTYGAGRLVEQLAEHKYQFCVVDPVGTWWGLRLAADGKGKGLDVPVFGGQHGDLPLPSSAGKKIGELVATRSSSVVLDISEMIVSEQRRFVSDYAAELFQAKKRNKSPLLVVWEECQEFMPQHVMGEQATMLSNLQRLVKLGRNYGIGDALVSQRPQAVNKECLNQTELMLAFQLTGPQERKAIDGWVQEVGAGDREIANELPGLKEGTAICWSPSWLNHFGRHKVLAKWTYDASATPERREIEASKALPPINLKELKAALAAAEVEVADNDPKLLKAEVTRLRGELARAGKAAPAAVRVTKPQVLLQASPALRRAIGLVGRLVDRVARDLDQATKDAQALTVVVKAASTEASGSVPASPGGTVPPQPNGAPIQHAPKRSTPAGPSFGGDDDGDWRPQGGALRMLKAIASSLADGLTWRQVATLARMKHSGGSFGTYKSALRTHGCIEERGELVYLTDVGRGFAGEVEAPASGPELVEMWKRRLSGKAKLMLEVVVEQGPGGTISRADLAERVNMAAGGGSFGTYLSALRSNGLVEDRDEGLTLTAAEIFFR